jgi:membrane protease YdiL (CAAX protease family)
MGAGFPEQVLQHFVVWLTLIVCLGVFTSWCWALRRLLAGQPQAHRPDPPWGGGTALLVVVIYILANVVGFVGYALAARGVSAAKPASARARVDGTAAAKTNGEKAESSVAHAAGDDGQPASPEPDRVQPDRASGEGRFSLIEVMFVQTATNAVLLIVVPFVVRLASGARLSDFGLSFRGLHRQVAVGVLAVLVITPIVYLIQALAVLLLAAFHGHPQSHPLEKMLREQFSGGVAYLAVLSAVVVAPMLEELLFRGILQRWLVKLLAPTPTGLWPDWRSEIPDEPATFELVVDPKLHGISNNSSSRFYVRVAIILTSLIFAGVHAPQWPAPIPLFVLSVAIGVIYHRTGSLISAICMHGVFNGLSTAWLLLVSLGR